jgi:hypothetical protein
MKTVLNKTKKLFFKKWLYKITVSFSKANYIKRYSSDYLEMISKDKRGFYFANFDKTDAKRVLALKNKISEWQSEYEFQTRSEGDGLSFFTNTVDFLDVIKSHFDKKIIEIVEPEDAQSLNLLKNNVNVVICEKLPKNNFRYRIYLNGKYSFPADLSQSFYKWCEKYESKISIPYGLKYNLRSQRDFRPYGSYFYTSDDKILSMALMFLGKHIQNTEKFVLKSEINE